MPSHVKEALCSIYSKGWMLGGGKHWLWFMGTHKGPANLPSPSSTGTFISEHRHGRVSWLHCAVPVEMGERRWLQSSYLHVDLWANSKVLFLFLYFWLHFQPPGALQPYIQGDNQRQGSHLTKACSHLQFCLGPPCNPKDVGCSWGASHPAQARNGADLYITPLPSKFL